MKKVIAAVVFMLLVAVFAQFGASDVAFANDGKTMPPQNLSVSERDGNYYLTFENVPGNNGYEVVVNGTATVVEKDVTTVQINVESGSEFSVKIRTICADETRTSDFYETTLVIGRALSAPEKLTMSADKKLSFSAVDGAASYDVVINGVSVLKSATKTEIELIDVLTSPINYEIKVRATGGKGYDAGEWATTTYECRKTIESPRLALENKTVSWAKSEGANEYSVVVTFMETEIEKVDRFSGTSFDLSELVAKHGAGEYAVKVQALSNGNYDYSDVTTIYYRNYLTLEAPTVAVNGTIVSWTKVENAVDYTIKIDGRIISTNVTAESFDVSPYVAEVKTYTIAVVANANGWYYKSAEGTATFVKTGALSSPVPTASGSVVSWTKVLGATAYDVYVGGEKVLTVTETTADISTYLQQGENKVKIVATAEGFSDGVSEEIVVIGSTSESTGLKTYKLIIAANESDYIVFVDGQRTDKKIENGKITLPDTAEKMIIVPDITNLPAEGGYVMLFSEIDLTTAAKKGEEYAVQGWIADSFDNTRLTIIGEGEGTNELGEYIVDGGNKVYYLNEKGKYRPKQPGEE